MMLTFGKKMLCDYGLRPNQSNGELLGSSETRTPDNALEVRGTKNATVRVRLFPRESQPCSSTCWWTVNLKSRGVFRRNKCCKIVECVGTKTFTSTKGRYSIDGENVVIAGQLEDDSLEGKYFLLRLEQCSENADVEGNLAAAAAMYEGTLARSRDSSSGDWEITHDAMIFRELSGE